MDATRNHGCISGKGSLTYQHPLHFIIEQLLIVLVGFNFVIVFFFMMERILVPAAGSGAILYLMTFANDLQFASCNMHIQVYCNLQLQYRRVPIHDKSTAGTRTPWYLRRLSGRVHTTSRMRRVGRECRIDGHRRHVTRLPHGQVGQEPPQRVLAHNGNLRLGRQIERVTAQSTKRKLCKDKIWRRKVEE